MERACGLPPPNPVLCHMSDLKMARRIALRPKTPICRNDTDGQRLTNQTRHFVHKKSITVNKHSCWRVNTGCQAWYAECRTCSMKTSERIPCLRYGDRVRFIGDHPNTGRVCTIIRALPNPSGRPEHQWYDVKFDDATLGRFLAKYLIVSGADKEAGAA